MFYAAADVRFFGDTAGESAVKLTKNRAARTAVFVKAIKRGENAKNSGKTSAIQVSFCYNDIVFSGGQPGCSYF